MKEAQDAPPKKSKNPHQKGKERDPLRQLVGPQLLASQEWTMTASRYTSQPDIPEQPCRAEKMQDHRDSSAMK
jgi:hypothetical protein